MTFMDEAIKEAYNGIEHHHGGPFGAVVVKGETIVGRGHNRVLSKKDPTCHGEIEAIRDACTNLDTFDLSDCTIYTTAEPCPMCLGAILWANIKTVYYGCNRSDTDSIGFRDDIFYRFLDGESHLLQIHERQREECLELFKSYKEDRKRELY